MKIEEWIPVTEFCFHHNVELSFVYSLNDAGLITIHIDEEKQYVPISQLTHLEKLVRLNQEMDINIEGIETISYLLNRISLMQKKMQNISNRLNFYEEP